MANTKRQTCPSCGAALCLAPGEQMVVCTYCGVGNAIKWDKDEMPPERSRPATPRPKAPPTTPVVVKKQGHKASRKADREQLRAGREQLREVHAQIAQITALSSYPEKKEELAALRTQRNSLRVIVSRQDARRAKRQDPSYSLLLVLFLTVVISLTLVVMGEDMDPLYTLILGFVLMILLQILAG